MRTRVKICGITRLEDAAAVAQAGADAIGLVFYPPSPRNVEVEWARQLRFSLPPLVGAVALFVNPSAALVREVIERVKPDLLQFHGEEPPAFCASHGMPYIKAFRVRPQCDLLEYLLPYRDATGWLADAYVDGYGGGGTSFDWSLIPRQRPKPLLLSGGLTPSNVGAAIRSVRPWGVDVSSGVESAKGIKDAARIGAFVSEVKNADLQAA